MRTIKESTHSKDFPDCFYRVTVKGLCVRDGKVLLVHEPETLSGKWEMPGGGLDFGEDIRAGLKRELEEEMGLKIIKVSERPVYVWTHKYEGKRGMEWFYSLVLAYRVEFESLDFTPTDECDEVKFFYQEDLKKSVDLNGQTQELADYFDPKDFPDNF